MKRTLLLLLLSTISIYSIQGQNNELLIGKWKVLDLYKREIVDSTKLSSSSWEMQKKIEAIVRETTFYFKKNGHFKSFLLGSNVEGTWTLEGKQGTLTANIGRVTKFEIIELKEDELIIELGKSKLIMIKVQSTIEDETEEVIKEIQTVSSTINQIAKLWYIKRKESPNKSEENIQTVSKMIAGAYYKFEKNGKYTAEILGVKIKGKWEFGKDNRSIITIKNGEKQIWQIQKVTETELVLLQGLTDNKWIFSTILE